MRRRRSSHVQLTYNLSYAKSVREIVEVVEIFNAFIDGNGYLMGERIPSNVIPDEPKTNLINILWIFGKRYCKWKLH